jgi:3-mercaptopyruvate sulfurtransferase SseA
MDKEYKRVFALIGGWKAWQKAGYPVEDKRNYNQ